MYRERASERSIEESAGEAERERKGAKNRRKTNMNFYEFSELCYTRRTTSVEAGIYIHTALHILSLSALFVLSEGLENQIDSSLFSTERSEATAVIGEIEK